MVTGSCLCGRFAFEVDGFLELMGHCHCSYCRKLHGSAFATFVGAPAGGFRWTRGEGEAASYESSPGTRRPFCPDCGSKVPGPAHDGVVFLPAGLLDGDPAASQPAHIYVAAKAPWYEIGGDAARFDAAPPGMEDPKLATPSRPRAAGPDTIAGGCLCGTVAWELLETPGRMGHCHCSRCRKLRSAAFSTQVFVPHGGFRWLSGEDAVQEYWLPGAAFFGNAFCPHCGGPVPRVSERAPAVLVPAGPLDDDPGSRPQAHIYVGSKAPWWEITDDLPQFEEMPSA